MNPVSVTCRRTLSQARSRCSTAVAVALFLAAAAVSFALGLERAEGSRQLLSAVWAASLSPLLPLIAAVLSMDVWSEERGSGRMDLLLSVAVPERDFVVGKFLGVWTGLVLSVSLSLAFSLASLYLFAPDIFDGVCFAAFAPAFAMLVTQGALWCAVGVLASAAFMRGAVAAFATVASVVVLPRAVWFAMSVWFRSGGSPFGEMPFDAHAVDAAAGVVSTGALLSYAAFIVASLLAATKLVVMRRFSGRRSRGGRFSCIFSIALSAVCAVSLSVLAVRLDVALDLPVSGNASFSPRMRHVLSESSGHVTATCFMSRHDPSFRQVSHFLRALKGQANSAGGLALSVVFVDPSWDIGAAERLVRLGVEEKSVVFEKGRRFAALPVDADFGDRSVASAIRRVAMPPQRRGVYWTVGHGETSFGSYSNWGMSDMARELSREGYRNMALDLAGEGGIPSDCALIIVAGAKNDFSRAELGRVDAYLKAGGRLLVLMGRPGEGGVSSILPAWGVRPATRPLSKARTVSGSDVIVSDFADHAVSSSLAGSRIILEEPLVFDMSAAAESVSGADRIEFTPIASVGADAVAVAAERGAGAGLDLAIRPTRIVVVGDASFAMNGQLAARASANRDFFMNAVAYLSGSDPLGSDGTDTGMLASGADRGQRIKFVAFSAGVAPAVVFLVLVAVAVHRRRRR